jgi:hypothetical protein
MLTLLTMLAATSAATADIRPLLREQGFGGPLNGRETIKYVGHIPQGHNDYRIYIYRGVFRPVPEGVDHGVNRLIVMLNGSIFVGEYDSSMPTSCNVRGHKVVCANGTVEFTKHGPPREISFDGEVERMALGNKVLKKN